MKIKTSDLTGNALDWAVAKAEGVTLHDFGRGALEAWVKDSLTGEDEYIAFYRPSTDWSQGGPIIEREGLWVHDHAAASPAIAHLCTPDKKWFAFAKHSHDGTAPRCYYGETFLIAAMRAYVASKLGDEVDVPDELARG